DIDGCAIHTSYLAGFLGRATQGTADEGGESRCLGRWLTRFHGPSSSSRGVVPESYRRRPMCRREGSGDKPLAMRSALTKCMMPASCGKNSWANVVLPAPFGPAMIMQRGDAGNGVFTAKAPRA